MTRTVVAVGAAAEIRAATEEAGAVLRAGGLVAFPTESFYGLGAMALDARAVARVFSVKGRPDDKPVLVLVDSVDMVDRVAVDVPPEARELMSRYWPGPLTLVLRAAAHVPEALTARTGTIGVRWPGHPTAVGLVRATDAPVTAPSANPSGALPPTTAAGVRAYFDGRIEMILDGGATAGGPGSTIADCTHWPPRVLRAGPIEL